MWVPCHRFRLTVSSTVDNLDDGLKTANLNCTMAVSVCLSRLVPTEVLFDSLRNGNPPSLTAHHQLITSPDYDSSRWSPPDPKPRRNWIRPLYQRLRTRTMPSCLNQPQRLAKGTLEVYLHRVQSRPWSPGCPSQKWPNLRPNAGRTRSGPPQ